MDETATWLRKGGSALSRIARWLLLAAAIPLAVAWLGEPLSGTASADEPIGEAEAQLTFEQPTTSEDTVSLLVRLTDADGQPIARTQVEFFVSPDFFGERPVSLQTAITNTDGLALLKYVPTWDGAHRMTAVFPGNADYQAGETTTVMTVSNARAAAVSVSEDGTTLRLVRLWAAPAITLGAVAVWLLIGAILVRVGWGIWRERGRGEDVIALPATAVERLRAVRMDSQPPERE